MEKDKIIKHLMEEAEWLRHLLSKEQEEREKERQEMILKHKSELDELQQEVDRYKRKNRKKELRRAVLKRDGKKCVKCGSEEFLQVDHIIPLSEGGADKPRNCQTLCIDCHIDDIQKGVRPFTVP